jgi:hypothetical protein
MGISDKLGKQMFTACPLLSELTSTLILFTSKIYFVAVNRFGSAHYWLAPHLGQVSGGGPFRMDQPHSAQVSTSSPSIPRIIGPHLDAPQGPVPAPVRRLTISKVFAPACITFTMIPLRILLHRQIGR